MSTLLSPSHASVSCLDRPLPRVEVRAQRRYRRVALGVALILSLGVGLSPVAAADEVDDLIASMEEMSRDVAAKNEEFKAAEEQVALFVEEAARSREDAERAEKEARDARREEVHAQDALDLIAGSRYRMEGLDSRVITLGADDPSEFIEGTAYLGTISRRADQAVSKLKDTVAAAVERQDAATTAVDEAESKQAELEKKLEELRKEKEELEASVEDMRRQVDELQGEERERWEIKNNPIEIASDIVAAASSQAGSSAVSAALSRIGSPYSWGATGPGAFDCSGLMYWAYQQQGVTIPRTSQAQIAGGMPVSPTPDSLEPGDIIGYYPGTTHVGMYIGDGQVVHASDYGIPVQVVAYDSMPITGAARY